MRLKLKNLTVLIGLICTSRMTTYGAAMTLKYDGTAHIYDKEPIALYVNNEVVESSIMPPVQIDGYVLVPTREVFNAMGATVQWRSEERKVYIEDQNSLIVLELDSHEAWVNGEIKVMDMAPKVINDKVMVPIRFISETLGFHVDWLGVERAVYITEKNSVINQGGTNDNTPEGGQDIGIEELPEDNISEEVIDTQWDSLSKVFPILTYDNVTQTMAIAEDIAVSDVEVEDIYTKRKIVLHINKPLDITESSWQGHLGYLKGVTVTKTGTGIQIAIETNTVCATTLSQQNGQLMIQFMKPREKYDKIVVIDAGHGGSDNGTSANGVNEKDLTLAYGNALCTLLEGNDNIKVYATRAVDLYATEGDGIVGKQYPTLDMRVNLANEIVPDLYISIHINSYSNISPNGIETYYYASSDSRGQIFANMVQEALVNEFNMTNRKAKHGDLKVIRETNDPAVLIEAGFISNPTDYEILTAADYPNRFAQVVYDCILSYYMQGLN